MLLRIIASIVVIIVMVLAPYWLFLAILLIACVFIPLYIEGALIAVIHDAFFSATTSAHFGFRSITFLITIASIGLVYLIRTLVRQRT